ncbi:MAG: PIG-L family deacetylase [Methanomassiliicoccales archaeon]|nr:PIG-L family deacetylase [Methanomassiliicoccales archaeon]
MSGNEARLELRYILERIRKRVSVAKNLSGSSWWPKEVEVPPGDRFLIVAPHPDDDAIGCGGTILKLVDAGRSVRIVYLSVQSSKDFSRRERLDEIARSLEIMGVKDHSFLSKEFPPKNEIADMVEKELSTFKPDAVFVPSPLENHDQHLETFEAYSELRKGRDGNEDTILYEIWTPLIPNMIVDITRFMDRKLDAVNAHRTQTKDLDYARAAEGLNKYRAAISTREGYCEGFMFLTRADFLRTFQP